MEASLVAFLALHEIARAQDGLHPLLVAHFQRQRAITTNERIVSLADRRGDALRQAGPFPGSAPAGNRSAEDWIERPGILSPR